MGTQQGQGTGGPATAVRLCDSDAPEMVLARRLLAEEEAFFPLDCEVLLVPAPATRHQGGGEPAWREHYRSALAGHDRAGELLPECLEMIPRGQGGCLYRSPSGDYACILVLFPFTEMPPRIGQDTPPLRIRSLAEDYAGMTLAWRDSDDYFGREVCRLTEWSLRQKGFPESVTSRDGTEEADWRVLLSHEVGHRRLDQARVRCPAGEVLLRRFLADGLLPPSLYAATAPHEWLCEAYAAWHEGTCDPGTERVVLELREAVRSGREWAP